MASPQPDKYTKWSNELLEAFMKINLSAYQTRILLAIGRKTYGFKKKKDKIAISQFKELTHLKRPHISRALHELIQRNIIFKEDGYIGIQKDYDKWEKLPIGAHQKLPIGARKITPRGNKSVPIGAPQKKERNIKEKKKYASVPSQEQINEFSLPKIKEFLTGFSETLYQANIFPKVNAFVNSQYKKKKNPRAILHALVRVHIKHSIDKSINSWAYANKVIEAEDGNYNARQYGKIEGKNI